MTAPNGLVGTASSGTNQLLGYGQSTVTNLGSSTSTISYTYNAAGDITNQGSKTFSFNAEQRLSSMATGATGTSPTTYYTHNALGQRVFKTEPITGTPTTSDNGYAFVYDEDGNLLGEYGTGGASSTGSTEYIWLPTPNGPMPIAAAINDSLFAIHADNLNTPRRLSNTSTVAVWQWKYSAFGDEQPTIAANRFADLSMNPNPGTTTVASVTFNLRYPGQYADTESGLSYNYFRSYDSGSGRYTQADPIGLDRGWNRFGYVGENALWATDPMGLQTAGPRGIPLPGPAPGPGAGGRGGYDPKTDTYTPPSSGLTWPKWLTPKTALERCEAGCEETYDREIEECRAYSAMTGDKYTFVSCKKQAERHLSQCMADCPKNCK